MKIVIMLPTYNERQGIEPLLKELSILSNKGLEISILVIDDNSPDGTADFVTSLNLPNVDILKRQIGRAHV